MADTTVGDFVRLCEAWRRHLGQTHTAFVTWLGRDATEWAHVRSGRRGPSDEFVRAVRERAAEDGGPWAAALDAALQRDVLTRVAIRPQKARPTRSPRQVAVRATVSHLTPTDTPAGAA